MLLLILCYGHLADPYKKCNNNPIMIHIQIFYLSCFIEFDITVNTYICHLFFLKNVIIYFCYKDKGNLFIISLVLVVGEGKGDNCNSDLRETILIIFPSLLK